jgi:hypothetical protein
LIEAGHAPLSVWRQCELLRLPRASLYYEPSREGAENLLWMRLLDEQYTATPFCGIRRLTAWLRSQGYAVNHERVDRLLPSVKNEEVYRKEYTAVPEARQGLGGYFTFYNQERLHQAFAYRTPATAYLGGWTTTGCRTRPPLPGTFATLRLRSSGRQRRPEQQSRSKPASTSVLPQRAESSMQLKGESLWTTHGASCYCDYPSAF